MRHSAANVSHPDVRISRDPLGRSASENAASHLHDHAVVDAVTAVSWWFEFFSCARPEWFTGTRLEMQRSVSAIKSAALDY